MSARQAFRLLGATVAVNSAALAMALTLAPLLAVELGASPGVVGFLAATLSLLPLFLAFRAGNWVDSVGPKLGLWSSSFLLALAPMAIFVHPSIGALFVAEGLLGLSNLLAVVAGQAFTAILGSADHHEGNFGWYATFVSAGQIAGPILAGVMADRHGYTAAFAITAGVAVTGLIVTWFLPNARQPRESGLPSGKQERELSRAAALLSVPEIQVAVVFTFSIAFAQSIFLSFFPVILQGAGISTGIIGLLIALRALVSTVLRPFLPAFVTWLGNRRKALIAMVALMAVASATIAVEPGVGMAATASLLAGIAWGIAPPISIVMVVAGAASAEIGFALGLRFGVNRLAQLVGPLVIGFVGDLSSLRVGFLVTGAIIATSLGYTLMPLHDKSVDQ